jgi:hypothetical protein
MVFMDPLFRLVTEMFFMAPMFWLARGEMIFMEPPVMIAHWNYFYGAPGMIGRWSDFYEPLGNGFVEAAILSWSWLSLLVFSLRWEWLLAGRGSDSSWETSHEKSAIGVNRLSLACLQKPSTIYKTTVWYCQKNVLRKIMYNL